MKKGWEKTNLSLMLAFALSFFACPLAGEEKESKPVSSESGFTINYNTVSMIEYIRFASKICRVNFIYEESDVDFPITVVSDEPVTAKNVMATLLQVLRIHGLTLLEQENNLVIHKSDDVRQVATLVTDADQEGISPLVTRIFRIRNAKPDSVAAIIRPMISGSALLEVSLETRQLILTDITANVKKVATLIENLDSPYAPLEIKTYEVQFNHPQVLVELAQQLMVPLAQGNPLLLVPQPQTNRIFVVATPELALKAVQVIQDLDQQPKDQVLGGKKLQGENVFVYKAQNRSGEEILKGLRQIGSNLQHSGVPDADLLEAIRHAKWIADTQSLMIVGTPDAISKIKEFLHALDSVSSATLDKASFFLYKPQTKTAEQVAGALHEMTTNLKGTKGKDPALIETLESVKINPSTQTLMFAGEERTFPWIRELLATIDPANPLGADQKMALHNTFFLYKIQKAKPSNLEASLKDFSKSLNKSNVSDKGLSHAIEGMRYIKETHSLLFTGDASSLGKLESLLPSFDLDSALETANQPAYFIYKLQNATGEQMEDDLDHLAKDFKHSGMKDSEVISVIDNLRVIKETNSLLLTGTPKAIEEVKGLIAKYDYARATERGKEFYLYKPQNVPADHLQKSLHEISTNLKKSELADPELLRTIDMAKYVQSTNSLIFTGTSDSLQKIQVLLKDLDSLALSPTQHLGKRTFLLYKIKQASGPQMVSSFKAMATDLKKAKSTDKDLIHALETVRYVKDTQSLVFTGTEESLARVETLAAHLDVAGRSSPISSGDAPSNFFVYKPQFVPGDELEKILEEFSEQLKTSALNDPELFQAIASTRWIEKTHSLIFTGTPKALDQVKLLLADFDVSSNATGIGGGGIQTIDNTGFLVYKLQFHRGDEIQGAMRQIAKDLTASNASINQNLLNAINSIQWLQVTNSLLCNGDQETLTRLRELLKNLDVPLKQVFIEMLVIQTTMTNALAFGLEWGGNYKYRDKFAGNLYNTNPGALSAGNTTTFSPDAFTSNLAALSPNSGTTSTPTPQLIPPGAGFDLGVIGQVIRHKGQTFLTLGTLLQALQTDDETTVVMTPKIITQDGRTSTFFQGENIPFVGSFVNNVTNSTVNTANIEYRDIGFNLTITPVLGNSEIVTLDIALDRSQTLTDITASTLNNNAQTAQGIITTKTNMQTTVHVPNDNFLILSGMANNSNSKVKQGIPCLGGLPAIGALFSQASDTVVNSNIVIFLRPHVIESKEDMLKLAKKEEEYFRDQSPTPYLQHNFDEAMELIKTMEDE